MAQRPWASPDDVRAYTDFDEVNKRTDEKLKIDISRAETYVMTYTHNKDFLDDKLYPEIPEEVKTAVIILSEAYAHNAVEKTKTVKSETFDDYSYTAESSMIDISSIAEDVAPLLEDYKKAKANHLVNMNLRKL